MTVQTPVPPRPRTASRVVSILAIVCGGVVAAATLWSGAVPTVAAARERSEQRAVSAEGIDAVALDVSMARLTLRFDDVDEATLDTRETGGGWVLRDDDGTLVVEAPNRPVSGWFGAQGGDATLTLPTSLEGVDLAASFGAGELVADGRFGAIRIEPGAGALTLSGSARSLVVQMDAGAADIDLEGVSTADLDLGAGATTVRLSGEAPRRVGITVSAGSLELTLPDAEYDVTTDQAFGGVDNRLRTASGAANTVDVGVTAGSVALLVD